MHRQQAVEHTPLEIRPGTPLIFLDIDGVLNRTKHGSHVRVDDDLMSNLLLLVKSTGARIIWSTFWRGFRTYLDYLLFRYGLEPSVGVTPGELSTEGRSAVDEAPYACRAEEIASFLDGLSPQARHSFVVIDDREVVAGGARPGFDALPAAKQRLELRLSPYFVRTDAAEGLTAAKVDAAIDILRTQGSMLRGAREAARRLLSTTSSSET